MISIDRIREIIYSVFEEFCNEFLKNVKIYEILSHGNNCRRVSEHICVTSGSDSIGSEFKIRVVVK